MVRCTQAVKRKLIQGVLINGMCDFADGTRAARRRAYERRAFVTHKPICFNCNLLQLFAFVLCVPLPTRQKLRFHHITQTQVRLFLTCGNPCACSTSDCAVWMRSWRTKRSGIISEMPLSMRVPSVSPTNDDNLCREMSLTEWWEKSPRGKEGVHLFRVHAAHSCIGRTKHMRKGEASIIYETQS